MAVRLSSGLANYMAGNGSLAGAFADAVIDLYTGAQPASADAAATGTLLGTLTNNGTANAPIPIGASATTAGAVGTASGVTPSCVAVDTGTAGWFRVRKVDDTPGATTAAVRLDGTIAASGAELNMTNRSVTTGGTISLAAISIVIPRG